MSKYSINLKMYFQIIYNMYNNNMYFQITDNIHAHLKYTLCLYLNTLLRVNRLSNNQHFKKMNMCSMRKIIIQQVFYMRFIEL